MNSRQKYLKNVITNLNNDDYGGDIGEGMSLALLAILKHRWGADLIVSLKERSVEQFQLTRLKSS